MSRGEVRPGDFADLSAVFRKALDLVGKGADVREALDKALRELYPLVHADLSRRVDDAFTSLKRERGWGDLRTLRELASGRRHPGPTGTATGGRNADSSHHMDVAVDLQRVFFAAHAKCQAGFDPVNALEMACTELYPLIHRKVFVAASSQLKSFMEREGVGARTALRRLSGGGR